MSEPPAMPEDVSAGDALAPSEPEDPSRQALAQARARVYGLLAATFDGEMETLATALDDDALVQLGAVLPVAIETSDLDATDYDPEALGVGYDNLFVVPGAHYVPPFASAHATDPSEEFESDSPHHTAGEAGELLGDSAADMAHLYEAAGFEPERGDGIPDHLAACFEFMYVLCDREAALLDAPDPNETELDGVGQLQAVTLSHLGWLDQFEEAVAAEDTVEGVFATLARIARIFAAWDAREGVRADSQTFAEQSTPDQ